MKKNNLAKVLVTLLIIITFLVAMLNFVFQPIKDIYIEKPGTANDLKSIVTVNGQKDKQKGEFRLTSVGIMQATPFFYINSLFSPIDSYVSQESLMGNANMEEYDKLQQYFMESSENNAKMMALKLAGKEYEMKYEGVYVMDVNSDSNFVNKLQMGDLITGVNHQKFDSADEMIKYITSGKVGDKISVQFKRNGKDKEVTGKLKLVKGLGKPGIGVGLVTKTSVISPDKIKIDVGSIGGPSAGMMFTLEAYEMLTGKDLRHGQNIAGTGEMLRDGKIGRIGGIDKKVVAAEEAGSTIFLAPDDEITAEMKKLDPTIKSNYEEAKETAKKLNLNIKVVPVKTIEDAIQYLENSK